MPNLAAGPYKNRSDPTKINNPKDVTNSGSIADEAFPRNSRHCTLMFEHINHSMLWLRRACEVPKSPNPTRRLDYHRPGFPCHFDYVSVATVSVRRSFGH
jgi:hypothetical protein